MILKTLVVLCTMLFVGVGLSVTAPAAEENRAVMQCIGEDTLIFPSLLDASVVTNFEEHAILRAIRTGKPVDSAYFVFIK